MNIKTGGKWMFIHPKMEPLVMPHGHILRRMGAMGKKRTTTLEGAGSELKNVSPKWVALVNGKD